jgi:hypothetical protein
VSDDDHVPDVQPTVGWRSLLAGLALAVGLVSMAAGGAWAIDAGQRTAGPDYEFDLDPDPNAGYEFEALSPAGRNATLAALANASNRTTVNASAYPENYPERYDDNDYYNTSVIYVVYDYDVYQVYARPGGNASDGALVDVDRVPGAHYNYSDLSEEAQRIVERAADGETPRAALPPEFDASAFGGSVGQGRYYVRYQGDYHVLVVTETSPLGIDAAVQQAGIVLFLIGLVLTGIGGAGLSGRSE